MYNACCSSNYMYCKTLAFGGYLILAILTVKTESAKISLPILHVFTELKSRLR